MKKIKNSIIVTLLAGVLQAQEAMPINLQNVLELAGANNLTIKEFQQKQEAANANFTRAGEWWYPKLYAGVKTQQVWGASMGANGAFFTDVSNENLWGGVGANVALNFADAKYKTKAAQLRAKASSYDTQAQRNKTLLKCINAYYDMLGEQLKMQAYADLVAQSKEIMQQIDIQVQVGLRYQSELLLAKSNHTYFKLEVLNSQNAYKLKSNELAKLLDLDLDIVLMSSEKFSIPLEFEAITPFGEESAYENRFEIKAIESTISATKEQKKNITNGLWLPELSVDMYTSYFGGLSGDIVNASPNHGAKQLYPTTGLSASLMWKIPLERLVSSGEVQLCDVEIKSQMLKSKQLKREIKQEIDDAKQQLLVGREQIILAKEALELTAEALNQSIERQKLGTVKPFEVFQVQQIYMQAKIDYFKTINNYNKAQFALRVAKGETL
ncbi:TolC family protein [Sulfurimonas sp.]|uniref:TolC family protein n=1 Tax=Sulfurimonas sp. TaxID=2022749 RepID=UPI0025FC0804|nr:TolC family protein [Sulfurimonas sp.]